MATLRLEPESAVASIAARLKVREQIDEYIAEVVKRYDGLRAFEDLLIEAGISTKVKTITWEVR